MTAPASNPAFRLTPASKPAFQAVSLLWPGRRGVFRPVYSGIPSFLPSPAKQAGAGGCERSSMGLLAGRRFLVSLDDDDEPEACAAALEALGARIIWSADEVGDLRTLELARVHSKCRLPPEAALSPTWLRYQLEWSEEKLLDPGFSPLFRPLGGGAGVPEMRKAVICLAGFRGNHRR